MSKLSDHLAYYPDPLLDRETFNAKWNAKQEMKELAYDQPRKNSSYFNHQRLNQIFMSPQTGNKVLYVLADPGVGKTCTTIGIAETWHEFVEQYQTIDATEVKELKKHKALILAKNELAVSNIFKKDIIETCTANFYLSEENIEAITSSRNYEAAKTRSTAPFYEINTHSKFASYVAKTSPLVISKEYSHRVIIIDEVHELNTVLTEDMDGNIVGVEKRKKVYNPLLKFLDNVFGCVIIMVTATPIVNEVTDLPSILNLALPRNQRISKREFDSAVAGDDLERIRQSLENILLPRFLGKISRIEASGEDKKTIIRSNENIPGLYLKGMSRISDKELWVTTIDSIDGPTNRYKIDYSYISQIHLNEALKIKKDDVALLEEGDDIVRKKNQNAFHTLSTQLDNIIWPDGSYGSKTVSKYINVNPATQRTEFTPEFMNNFNWFLDEAREEFARHYDPTTPQISSLFRSRKGIKVQDLSFAADGNGNDLDIFAILRTIRTRYSPQNADIIEQALGIEYFNPSNGQWEYSLSKKNLLESHNQECVYIFNSLYDLGAQKDGLFFQFFGFERYTAQQSAIDQRGQITISKGNRYGILYSGSAKDSKKDNEVKLPIPSDEKMVVATHGRHMLELFNHPDNKHGEYLKILIGIKVSAQSINLLNVRQSHQSSRQWNEARNKQAETRADRPGSSHQAFDDSDIIEGDLSGFDPKKDPRVYKIIPRPGENPITLQLGVTRVGDVLTRKYVKMFRHVVYNRKAIEFFPQVTLANASLGIHMYELSAKKFIKSKIAFDIMEKMAFDLKLSNNPRFTEAGKVVPYGWNLPAGTVLETDYSTFNLFYADKQIDNIKMNIRSHFKTNYRASLEDLILLNSQYHSSTVVKAITQMVKDNEPLIDRSGSINFLQEKYDIFFLVKSLATSVKRSINLSNYYCEFVHARVTKDIEDFYQEGIQLKIMDYFTALRRMTSAREVKSFIGPLSFLIKQVLFETMIAKYKTLISENLLTRDHFDAINQSLKRYVAFAPNNGYVLHVLKNYVDQETDGRPQGHRNVSATAYTDVRIFSLLEGEWKTASETEGQVFLPMIKDYIKASSMALRLNYPYYGYVTGFVHETKNGDIKYKKFSIQNSEYLIKSNTSTTLAQTVNAKAAQVPGTEAKSWELPKLRLIMMTIPVDLYCLLEIYRLPNEPYNQYSSYRSSFNLVRLMEVNQGDPSAEFGFNDKHFKRYTEISKVNGEEYVHLVSFVHPEIEMSPLNLIFKRVLHFTNLHPSIMQWLFEDEIANADSAELKPTPEDAVEVEQFFYPGIKSGQNVVNAYVPPYPPGRNSYSNILEVLPQEHGNIFSLLINPVGVTNAFVRTNNDGGFFLGADSKIISSIRSLPEFVNPFQTNPRILRLYEMPMGKDGKVTTTPLAIDPVFLDSWQFLSVINIIRLIYLTFFLGGRIIFN